MTVLEQMSKLPTAEDFFHYLNVPYDPAVLNVSRLHILRRLGEYLPKAENEPDEEKARACYRALLQRAYDDFVRSTPIKERVFKVHQDAVRGVTSSLIQLTVPEIAEEGQ